MIFLKIFLLVFTFSAAYMFALLFNGNRDRSACSACGRCGK